MLRKQIISLSTTIMFATSKSIAVTFCLFLVTLLSTATAQFKDKNGYSNGVRDLSKKVYDQNYDNFNKVLEFAEMFSDPDLKADTMIGLYDAMDEVRHINDPLKAISLYNEVETLINNYYFQLHKAQLNDLERRYSSLKYIIIGKGAEILEAGVILHDCNTVNSTVQILLNELYKSNETLSDLNVREMVEKVRWVLPIEELLFTVGNISTHVRQNIDAMLALNNEKQITGQIQVEFIIKLAEMQQDTDYSTTVSAVKKQQVDALMSGPLQRLVRGDVGMYLKPSNGTKLYIQECLNSYRACVYSNTKVPHTAVLEVLIKKNPLKFNFLSKYYSNRPIHINPLEPKQPNGLRYNIYSSFDVAVSIDWQVQLDGDSLMLHNGTSILCGGNTLTLSGSEWYTYTRPIESYATYSKECKWFVESSKRV